MAKDRPLEWARHPNDAAEPGMGMDKACGMLGYEQMKLGRPGLYQHNIAGKN